MIKSNQNNFKILGIDPGIASIGIGIVEICNDKLKHLYDECITTKSNVEISQRLLIISQELQKIIQEYQPNEVAIEAQFLKRQAKTSHKVAQALGVLQFVCLQNQLQIYEYGPMQVKKTLVGFGRAEKEQIIYMVKAQLGIRAIKNNHSADALALALTHFSHRKFINKNP